MSYSAKHYHGRAEECVRLANLTGDEQIRAELSKLRQTYLHVAQRLRDQGFESPPDRE